MPRNDREDDRRRSSPYNSSGDRRSHRHKVFIYYIFGLYIVKDWCILVRLNAISVILIVILHLIRLKRKCLRYCLVIYTI